jgi:hypothetical protein
MPAAKGSPKATVQHDKHMAPAGKLRQFHSLPVEILQRKTRRFLIEFHSRHLEDLPRPCNDVMPVDVRLDFTLRLGGFCVKGEAEQRKE